MERGLTLEAAIIAAARLHAGHVDKAGAPYIRHPLRVMEAMESPQERILAVLHDTVEDCGWEALRRELPELPAWLKEALEAVTRRAEESYEAFIARAACHPIARRVKVADLRDNLAPWRIPNPSPSDIRRSEKYRRALAFLGA